MYFFRHVVMFLVILFTQEAFTFGNELKEALDKACGIRKQGCENISCFSIAQEAFMFNGFVIQQLHEQIDATKALRNRLDLMNRTRFEPSVQAYQGFVKALDELRLNFSFKNQNVFGLDMNPEMSKELSDSIRELEVHIERLEPTVKEDVELNEAFTSLFGLTSLMKETTQTMIFVSALDRSGASNLDKYPFFPRALGENPKYGIRETDMHGIWATLIYFGFALDRPGAAGRSNFRISPESIRDPRSILNSSKVLEEILNGITHNRKILEVSGNSKTFDISLIAPEHRQVSLYSGPKKSP